jgi:hypothetical protein
VLRAPEITPSDLEPRDTGTMQTPQSPSLEALIRDADREDAVAAALIRARSLPTNQTVQLPPQPGEDVTFVPAPKALIQSAIGNTTPNDASVAAAASGTGAQAINVGLNTSATEPPRTADIASVPNSGAAAATTAATTSAATTTAAVTSTPAPSATSSSATAESVAELRMLPEQQELKVGERRRVMLFLKTDAPLGLATATLRFDPKALAVRSVSQGGLAGDKALAPTLTQSVDPSGVLLVTVAPAAGAPPLTGEGLLLVIEIEGLAAGETSLQFDAEKVHLIATDGRTVHPRVTPGSFKVTQ